MKRFENEYLIALPYFLIFCMSLLRLELVQPYNFVPVFSCLFFFAATRPAREFVLPLSVLVSVDIFITTHRYGQSLTYDALVTWTWYLIAMLLGSGLLRKSWSWRRVATSALLASFSFFLVSNFAVWAVWQMYPRTLTGLGECYIAALPFFRNSLTSELSFSLSIFGLMNYVRSLASGELVRKHNVNLST